VPTNSTTINAGSSQLQIPAIILLLETVRASFSYLKKYRKRELALQGLLCQCEIILPYEYNYFVCNIVPVSINQMTVTVITAECSKTLASTPSKEWWGSPFSDSY
jgi:hypothetical protein